MDIKDEQVLANVIVHCRAAINFYYGLAKQRANLNEQKQLEKLYRDYSKKKITAEEVMIKLNKLKRKWEHNG